MMNGGRLAQRLPATCSHSQMLPSLLAPLMSRCAAQAALASKSSSILSTPANYSALAVKKPDEETEHLTYLLKRLRNVDTAALCDADKGLLAHRREDPYASSYVGLGLMNSSMHPRNHPQPGEDRAPGGGLVMAGIARTIQCTRPNDFLAVLRGLDLAKTGEVLVINTLDATRAVAGGLFLTEAARKNLAGIIVDGPVRDSDVLRSLPTRIYSTSVTPYAGTVQSIGEIDVPIVCAGVSVKSGDIVVGDSDGVVVASQRTFERCIDDAENTVSAEKNLMTGMHQGISFHSMSNYDEHLKAREQGKPSALDFRKKRLVTFDGVKPLHYD